MRTLGSADRRGTAEVPVVFDVTGTTTTAVTQRSCPLTVAVRGQAEHGGPSRSLGGCAMLEFRSRECWVCLVAVSTARLVGACLDSQIWIGPASLPPEQFRSRHGDCT